MKKNILKKYYTVILAAVISITSLGGLLLINNTNSNKPENIQTNNVLLKTQDKPSVSNIGVFPMVSGWALVQFYVNKATTDFKLEKATIINTSHTFKVDLTPIKYGNHIFNLDHLSKGEHNEFRLIFRYIDTNNVTQEIYYVIPPFVEE